MQPEFGVHSFRVATLKMIFGCWQNNNRTQTDAGISIMILEFSFLEYFSCRQNGSMIGKNYLERKK